MVDYVGGAGSDTFTGGADPDLIYGEGGNDILSGAGGDDRIYGGTGNDTLNGGDGDDLLDGGDGDDTLNGDAGADEITTGTGNDTVNGGTGSDLIVVGAHLNAADQINGGFGGGEVDILSISGTYASSIVFGATTVTNVEHFNIGTGQVRLTLHEATLTGLNARANFNGSAQLQTDLFWLDGSAATVGFNASSAPAPTG